MSASLNKVKVTNEKGSGKEPTNDKQTFECNICLDTARDAVVSMCGHLFCWSCLHQWLETQPNRQVCPVCNAAIIENKVVPIYGRGSTNQLDCREKLPPRPAGQRTYPTTGSYFDGFGLAGNGFYFSFGIGAHPEEHLSSKIFFEIAILFIVWLLLT